MKNIMAKAVFRRETVDSRTGELIEEESHYVDKQPSELFAMYRLTEGTEWIMSFTGNELKMMMLLVAIESQSTGVITMSSLTRQQLQKVFNKTERHVRGILASLVKKDALCKITSSDFILNPTYFFKGRSLELKDKLKTYQHYSSGAYKGKVIIENN